MALSPYFENDGITIYHGDCRDVLPELPEQSIDFVLTDPPYLVSYSGRWGSDWGTIEGDSDGCWVTPVFSEVWRLLKPDSLCLTFYGWPHADVFLGSWKQIGFRPVSLIVLIKSRWGLGRFTRAQHEQAYLLAKGRPPKPNNALSDVLEWEPTIPQLHPNQKPIRAISRLIASYSSAKACVLDPFCGSGTTLLASRAMGRPAIGIEIDERFCELAAIRLAQCRLEFPEPESICEQLHL